MSKDLMKLAHKLMQAIERGEADPLDIELSVPYQRLREEQGDIEPRLITDEILNEILSLKIGRIVELARIISAPDFLVNRLEEFTPRELGKMMVYRQPVSMNRISHESLTASLDRVFHHLDSMMREQPQEPSPRPGTIPDDFKFASEDSVFIDDLNRFLKKVPRKKRISVGELIATKDFDLFLKQFLYVVVLISRGDLTYFDETGEVLRQ